MQLVPVAVPLLLRLGAPPPGPASSEPPDAGWIPETPATSAVPAPADEDRRVRRSARSRERDGELVGDRGLIIATGVDGALWIGSTIGAVVLAFEIRETLGRCSATTYEQCEDASARLRRLTPPTVALVFVSGAALVGTLVPAIVLGVRRNRRGDLAAGGRARLAWTGAGLRLRF